MKLIYEGTDITEKTKVLSCVLEQYLFGHIDTMTFVVDNTQETWTGWKPKQGDVVSVTEQYADSGQMVIRDIRTANDNMILRAAPSRYIKQGHTRMWKSIRFKALVDQVAKGMGCTTKYYGVTDQKYDAIAQKGEGDLAFIDNICKLEGCGFQLRNGEISVISFDYIKQMANSGYELPSLSCRTYDLDYYSGCEVTDGKITGKAGDTSAELIKLAPTEMLQSLGEANRFARNMLTWYNFDRKGGTTLADGLQTELMPGSKFKITCNQWSQKPAIITRARYDLMKEKTKLWFALTGE